jgi:arabinose-5-phosphate isomerase
MSNDPSRNVVTLVRGLSPAQDEVLAETREVIRRQAAAIAALEHRLGGSFSQAVEVILSTPGHVVIFGVGKSGLVGRKIAATLASTGTPAIAINAAEAHHGDLGMVTARDTALLISASGETHEVNSLLPHLRRMDIPMIALVGRMDSTLAGQVDIALDVSVEREVCPNNLAPTTSTLTAMAMGDALAVALIRRRGFGPSDFARFHPGGTLGRQLLGCVKDAMRTADLPIVAPTDTVGESLMTMTAGRLGLVLVMSGERLVGLVTDGDLRRAMQRHADLLSLPVSEIMTRNPVTIHEDTPLAAAHQRMQQMKLKALVVVSSRGRVSGVVEVFDEK